jgi:hypothetical protein
MGRAMVVVATAVGGTLLASYSNGFEFFAFGGFWIWVFAAMFVITPDRSTTTEA